MLRVHSLRPLLVAFCTLCVPPVLAAPIFSDDAESGALTSPEGEWERILPGPALNAIQVSPEAAHRGAFGLRHVDGDATNGGQQIAAVAGFESTGGRLYSRFWFRHLPQSNSGNLLVFNISDLDAQLRVKYYPDGLRWELAGREGPGGQFVGPFSGPLVKTGAWQLVEFVIEGIGTPSGKLSLFLDRQHVKTRSDLDFVSRSVGGVEVGGSWSDLPEFKGVTDYDDVRVSEEPPASRIGVSLASGEETAHGCIPLTVSLHDTLDDALAPAPYDVDVSLVAPREPGSFFADRACETATHHATIPADSPTTTVYYAPRGPSVFQITAEHPDFFPGTLPLKTTTPQRVTCGDEWTFQPEGEPPADGHALSALSGELPAEIRFDAAPGRIQWTPGPEDEGDHHWLLEGSAPTPLELRVRCRDPWTTGCQTSPAPVALSAAALVVLGALRRRRR